MKSNRIGIGAVLGLSICLPSTAQTQMGSFSDQSLSGGLDLIGHRPRMATNLCAGGAIADFDRDGFQDIFYATGGGEPDALLMNNGDGTFTERGAEWGVRLTHRSTGAAVGDFDGDGWIDLYVTSHGPADREERGHHKLYRNDRGRGFVDVAPAMGVHLTGLVPDGWGASFGDIDGDGDLDLAVPGYRPPGGNHLFRNDGSHFTDITVSSGLDATLRGSYGFTVKIVDMDGDLDNDLLWVSDFGTGRYYRNDGNGQFTDYTAQSGTMVEDTEMGVTVNDFNEDGRLDFWVTTVNENGFYINQGNNVFLQLAQQSGVRDSGWGWGAVSFDWNHDTKVDMIGTSWESRHYSFLNVSPTPNQLSFTEVRNQIGVVGRVSGRGLSNFDFDNDGDQDFVVFGFNDPFLLFRNDLVAGPDAGWLRVSLDRGCSTSVPPDGIGAIVRARIGTRTMSRLMDAGSNYLSNSEFTAHFGLGSSAVVDELRVEWPDGHVSTMQNVAPNQHLVVRHPASQACFKPIGGGCRGAFGVPALSSRFGAAPSLGASLFLDAHDLAPTGGTATLLLGFYQQFPSIDLGALGMPRCHLHIGQTDLSPIMTTTVAGTAQWHIMVPMNSALTDLEFFAQVASPDMNANALGVVLSDALLGVCR